MKPELNQTHVGLYVLVKLTTNNMPKGGYGSPYTVMLESNVYQSLEDAQQAQTYEALKNSIKYDIFHLEFPIN
jgi:hypothetical protein